MRLQNITVGRFYVKKQVFVSYLARYNLPRMKVIKNIIAFIIGRSNQQQQKNKINLNDPNTKRIIDKQYTAEELEIKQMLKVIDKKRID